MSAREPRRRDDVLALALGTAIALIVGEVAVRGLHIGRPRGRTVRQEPVSDRSVRAPYQPGGLLVYHYPDNPRGYFDDEGRVVGHINAMGIRGPEFDVTKTTGVLRVAVLGDSFTLGIGVKDEDTLPAQLERELQRTSLPIQVLNFGVSGTSTVDQVALLERYVLDFDPDVVVIVVFLRDVGQRGTNRYLSAPTIPLLGRLQAHWQLLDAASYVIERSLMHRRMVRDYLDGYREDSAGWQAMKAALLRARALTGGRHVAFGVAVYPVLFGLNDRYPFRAVHEKLGAFCRSEGIPLFDLLGEFLGQRDSDLWVHTLDQHPNEVAQHLAAVGLARDLAPLLASKRLESRAPGPSKS